jgi:transcriptional regulator with XRE-family HTH domain
VKPDAAQHNPAPDYLRELIAQAGLTQREAARAIGISERMMRYYLSPEADPSHRAAPYPVQYALEGLINE